MKQILATIVLYKISAEQSQAFCSLCQVLSGDYAASQAIQILIFDNSPLRHEPPVEFQDSYFHDSSNPGLAPHYNAALKSAATASIPWLLLLDQDTTLTAGYVTELIELLKNSKIDQSVVAVVPKLVEKGIVQSPHYPPRFKRGLTISSTLYGIQQEKLHIYNSGAVLQVTALLSIGGFSEKFPLDYLDHVTFYQLQLLGGRIFLMHAAIEHELSGNKTVTRGDPAFLRRLRSIHDAEHMFYHLYGTPRQRLLYRLRTLRRACVAAKAGEPAQVPYFLKLALQV